MKEIIKTLGTVLILAGVCGLLSSLIQFIVFHDMPPTITELILGTLLIVLGIFTRKSAKRISEKNTDNK